MKGQAQKGEDEVQTLIWETQSAESLPYIFCTCTVPSGISKQLYFVENNEINTCLLQFFRLQLKVETLIKLLKLHKCVNSGRDCRGR